MFMQPMKLEVEQPQAHQMQSSHQHPQGKLNTPQREHIRLFQREGLIQFQSWPWVVEAAEVEVAPAQGVAVVAVA
jgi:hypothetical protein